MGTLEPEEHWLQAELASARSSAAQQAFWPKFDPWETPGVAETHNGFVHVCPKPRAQKHPKTVKGEPIFRS